MPHFDLEIVTFLTQDAKVRIKANTIEEAANFLDQHLQDSGTIDLADLPTNYPGNNSTISVTNCGDIELQEWEIEDVRTDEGEGTE